MAAQKNAFLQKRAIKICGLLLRHTKKLPIPIVEKVAASHSAYRVLVSTMLSPRTKDAVTAVASRRIFAIAPTLPVLAKFPISRIAKVIYPVGFFRTKAKHIRETARIILRKHKGKVPATIDELVALPGVGRKIASLVVSLCYGVPAICVDTHVHRISNRLGLVRTASPYETEQELMAVLPKKYWINWNTWLVMWGQNICTPQSPKCSECPLSTLCSKIGVAKKR